MKNNKKSVVLFISSGLGNALFQLSGGQAISRKLKREFKISNLFAKDNLFFRLIGYKIHNSPLQNNFLKTERFNLSSLIAVTILYFKAKFGSGRFKVINYYRLSYNQIEIFGTLYIHGYFQDKNYLSWEENKNLASKVLNFSNSQKNIKNNDLAIHVRYGDFVSDKAYSGGTKLVGNEFYSKSLLEFKKYKDIKKIFIVGIFSKEILDYLKKEVSKNFYSAEIIIENKSVLNDFLRIWQSKYVISSNSTFSFWSGYFGNSKVLSLPKIIRHYAYDESQSNKVIYSFE